MTANPSLIPGPRSFSALEEEMFEDLADAADLDTIVDSLFPNEELARPVKAPG